MPASTDEALRRAAARLAGTSDTPRLDAELLMAHAMGIPREAMLLGKGAAEVPASFAELVERRAGGEPIAYITGTRDFWTIAIAVAPGALIPRPDSETLIEAAVAHFGAAGPGTVLDLGTGPGTLLLAALDQWPRAKGIGIDRSAKALEMARGNARRLGMADRADFRMGDWARGIAERFDLVLCNPPYVEEGAALPRDVAGFEPAGALFAGADGLDAYRALAPGIPGLIAPGGMAAIELGAGQKDAVSALFARQGVRIGTRRDLGGHDRALLVYPE